MSRVPEGWKGKRIASLFSHVRRKNSTGCSNVLTISGQHGLVNQREYFNRSVAGENIDKYCLLKRGEFAYNRSSMNGYPCGAIKRLEHYDEGVLSTLYICFAARCGVCEPEFYKHVFESDVFFQELRGVVQVGARAHGLLNVTPSEFMNVSVVCPPLPEQKKIAAILSSVDDAIAATQAVIDQTRKVKEGLLQDLLTRGIGHIRFKQTEIGVIPEGWEVKRLENVVTSPITYGIVQAGVHVNDGVPYIRVSDMTGFELSPQGMLRTAPELAAKFKRSEVRAGEVVCALRGVIGHVMRVPEALDGANLTQGTARIAPDCRILSQEYLLWAMRSPVVNSQALCEAKGSALKEISLNSLKKLLIPIPCKEEQLRIVENLNAVLLCERFCCEKKEQYKDVKRGLMQDLLSGDVRICA